MPLEFDLSYRHAILSALLILDHHSDPKRAPAASQAVFALIMESLGHGDHIEHET